MDTNKLKGKALTLDDMQEIVKQLPEQKYSIFAQVIIFVWIIAFICLSGFNQALGAGLFIFLGGMYAGEKCAQLFTTYKNNKFLKELKEGKYDK